VTVLGEDQAHELDDEDQADGLGAVWLALRTLADEDGTTMDPNATLTMLRALVDDDDAPPSVGYLFAALDGWLSSGGFLPAAWANGRDRAEQAPPWWQVG
jgi:hypothetical protein